MEVEPAAGWRNGPNPELETSPPTVPVKIHPGAVTAMTKCTSMDAKRLCIYDISHKLNNSDTYDIGGTYTDGIPDLWFYFTTLVNPGKNYLLSLFVCHRKVGQFSIGISEPAEGSLIRRRDHILLPNILTWHTFKSARVNENHFIKTFALQENSIFLDTNTLCIPIKIDMSCKQILNNDIIKRIKLKHDLSDLLMKQEKSDFILESVTKKQYPTHQIVLAAHSPVLRELMKNTTSKTVFIDISDHDMELLLQFIYTGTIKNVHKLDCLKLLEIADRFQLKDLSLLTQHAINEQINVNNAVEVAAISEKYSLEELQSNVFRFIKNHPETLETEGWKNMDDVKLAKKLFMFIHKQRARD